jgi:subtilisin-like proprotein convertase family protein
MPLFRYLVRRSFRNGVLGLLSLCAIGWLAADAFVLAQRRTVPRTSESLPNQKKAKPVKRSTTNLARARVQQKTAPDGSLLGQPWAGAVPVSETTAEIMQRERLNATRLQRKARPEEREFEPPDRRGLPQNPAALPGGQWPPREAPVEQPSNERANPASTARIPQAPEIAPQAVTLNFTAGTLNDSGAFPPDAMGAVGPSQFLLAINGRIRVFDKQTGTLGVLDTDTDNFFNTVRGGASTSDPRVRFDRLSGRWFVVMINVPASFANNSLLIAVSDGATITPNSTWRFVALPQQLPAPSGDSGCFADYPTLGIDAQALYIGANMFCGDEFGGTSVFVVRKTSLLSNTNVVVTAFRNLTGTPNGNGPYTPQGVDNPDPNASAGYVIGVDRASFGALVLRRISDPGGTPTMSPNVFVNVLATSLPINVPHAGNTNGVNGYLDGIDDRLLAAQMRNGRLWTSHNIAVNNTGEVTGNRTRTAARWYELGDLNTDAPKLIQAGTLFAATANNSFNDRNHFMSSIAVSGQGHAALGCTVAGANEAINALTAGRLAADPLGTLHTPIVFTNSQAAYNPARNTGSQDGFRRWGDYSYTSVDPCDDMTMWTVQQYANAPDSYGVQVARLQAPPPATPIAVNPPSLPTGLPSVNLTLTGAAINGAGFYDPGAGFGCRLQAQISGGVTVNSVTYLNPTTIRLTVSTVNASAGLKNVTVINPDGQTVSANQLLTIGNCTYAAAPTTHDFTAAGGNGSLNVTAAAGCGWTAASNDPFITVTSGNTGTGNGTVNFSVASTVAGSRTGTLTVAGQIINITQNAGAGCNYTLTPPSQQFSAQGGYSSFTVASPSDCAWTATTNSSFVSLLLGSSGQGGGTVNFLVAVNATPISRTATITVAGQAFNLTQEPAPFEIAVDDGSFETSTGTSQGGITYRVNRLTPSSYPATLSGVAIYFSAVGGVKVGDEFTLLAGTNADGDNDINGTAFQNVEGLKITSLDEFSYYQLTTPLTITAGDFVVGFRITVAENVRATALDTTAPSQKRSYRSDDGVAFTLHDNLTGATPGNYGIRAQLVRPTRLLVKGGATLTAESCVPANGAIDPGETVTVSVTVQNDGANATSNLIAALQPTGGVSTTGLTQSYGAITPGTSVTRAFTFTAGGACGGGLTLTLNFNDSGQDLGAHSYSFVLGAAAASSVTFSFTGTPVAIPDGSATGVNVPLTISGFNGTLADLNLRFDGSQCTAAANATTVGLAHDYVGDLVVKLTSPQGTTVTLMNRPGGASNSGRNFCQTVLDDDAANATSIQLVSSSAASTIGPPYVGTYRPANPLSAFDGENPNGTWTLNVADVDTTASGSVRGFSLILSGFTCCQGSQPLLGYEADVAPRPNGNNLTTAADWTIMGRLVTGLLSAVSGSEFQRADCAPRTTLGDGQISAADYTQAGRYVAGLDPLTQAGGPLGPNPPTPAQLLAGPRQVRILEAAKDEILIPRRGPGSVIVAVKLHAAGHENAFSTSLHFDPAHWQFVSATVAEAALRGTLFLNDTQLATGDLGLVLALPPGQSLRAGKLDVAQLSFKATQPGSAEPLIVSFHDGVLARELVDPLARVLQTGNQLRLGVSFARSDPPVRVPRAVSPRARQLRH